jgi:hypothetical protein
MKSLDSAFSGERFHDHGAGTDASDESESFRVTPPAEAVSILGSSNVAIAEVDVVQGGVSSASLFVVSTRGGP